MSERKLNDKQINTLLTTFRFRYVTTKNLARQRNISHNSAYSALETLHRNGYLGKKHQKSYRLQNKPASYFLTPKAVRFLQNEQFKLDRDVLDSRLREKSKSSEFVDLQTAIHSAYIDFERELGEDAVIKTGSELASMEGVIKPLPSLYVKPTGDKHYFIELTDGQHLFIVKKRIRKYIDHYESDDWEFDQYPDVHIHRTSIADQRKLKEYIEEKMDDAYLDEEDLTISCRHVPL